MAKEFISQKDIEEEADLLLAAYQERYGRITSPPMPVAEVLECHLEFMLEFDNLQEKYATGDVLAEAYLEEKVVVVDASLDPVEHPEKEGRYHFTLAHEIGHWALHRDHFVNMAQDLFGNAVPSVICRSTHFKEPREYQADSFAGYLLMPKDFIHETWKDCFPEGGAHNVYEELENKRRLFGLDKEKPPPSCKLAGELASAYKVSAQAMQIRLCKMRLLELTPPEASLFD